MYSAMPGPQRYFFCAYRGARILGMKIQNAITINLIELDAKGAHFELKEL